MNDDSAKIEKATVTTGDPVSAFSLFSKSWEVIQKNLAVFVVLSIPTILSLASSFTSEKTAESTITSGANFVGGLSGIGLAGFAGGVFIFGVLLFILGLIIQALLTVAQLRGAEGQELSLGGIWDEARPVILPLFGLSLLTGLLVACGLLLLIIPGIIILRRYFLAPYILVDQKLGILDAMKASAELSKPFSRSIYGVIGVTILIAFIGMVPLVGAIASAIGGVIYSVAPAFRYLELKKLNA